MRISAHDSLCACAEMFARKDSALFWVSLLKARDSWATQVTSVWRLLPRELPKISVILSRRPRLSKEKLPLIYSDTPKLTLWLNNTGDASLLLMQPFGLEVPDNEL